MADIINYYDELLAGDSDATLVEIKQRLKDLKLQLSSKVLRPSSQKEEWLHQLELIEQAQAVFADEDSRERYDVGLRRTGTPEDAESREIDWTIRAWNYYYIGDYGAALVASRKAKEQSPQSPMPFIVAGWVQLHDEEWKQAKQEADEAFVLDDQVQDSVDVQMVRGTAYYFMGRFEHKTDPSSDYNRALTSFDKALPKASPGEQVEIHWRTGLVLEVMERYEDAFIAGIKGLEVDAEITDSLRSSLEKLTSDSINHLSAGEIGAAIQVYTSKRTKITESAIQSSSKAAIIANIDQNLSRLKRLQDLVARRTAAQEVPAPGWSPRRPLKAIGASLFLLPLTIALFYLSPQAGALSLMTVLALVGYIIYKFTKLNEHSVASNKYDAAQRELEEVRSGLDVTPSLNAIIWMKDPTT